MITDFKNVYVVTNKICRATLDDRYFPYITYPVDLINLKNTRKWFEGWICHFTDNGLTLNIQTIHTESQYKTVQIYGIKNATNQHVEFKVDYSVNDQLAYDYRYFHPAKLTETVHDIINISFRLKSAAHNIRSWQFYLADNAVEYGIKFDRPITRHDLSIMDDISQALGMVNLA